jgi:hypothetical protein
MSQTLGQKRIRPEHHELTESTKSNIDIFKTRSIENIDYLETMKGLNPSGEKSRLLALAQTKIEEATMWAVKGLTFKE